QDHAQADEIGAGRQRALLAGVEIEEIAGAQPSHAPVNLILAFTVQHDHERWRRGDQGRTARPQARQHDLAPAAGTARRFEMMIQYRKAAHLLYPTVLFILSHDNEHHQLCQAKLNETCLATNVAPHRSKSASTIKAMSQRRSW